VYLLDSEVLYARLLVMKKIISIVIWMN